ncbi:hypothetical protein [Maribellus sp. YY47]|uniref:hypothetical protein n=1 Tax=Maribellus sp. YY47 TaxID=2929486 RepID=UPI002000751F|nr:hypothetical protein [Maribellus sp. YY47]MCK3685261.1 hypothetical protein [Maribellus sp. YY47]
MKTILNICGSISKTEMLSPLKSHILANTSVVEASLPYAHYYGQLPQKNAQPNSIFLLVKKFYFLEEILSFSQSVEKCLLEQINFATALLEVNGKQIPAVRIKFFPDYKQLANLQSCLQNEGMVFLSDTNISGKVHTRIHKLFTLEEPKPGFYFDQTEMNKGYFLTDSRIPADKFVTVLDTIRNNSSCKLFDAVQGKFIMNGKVKEIIRVFAEGIDLELMKCIQQQFNKLFDVKREKKLYSA